ncbi:geranylgeranylglycerol-phosphategeranylgeranyltransferase [Thermogladius calderae 1633]|uniref:Geranylgeranylglycerol-phosphategeranylgeranyltransferase n=1 Tax=Thermogladius calderae (strain DSM 22663 / VKM B-2946 / 1633) TaxID=1184251 RepID=I3TDQ5_THEC1|nr:geranylgeranylglycerol-phosphategeranylgeranyltransferase [Thermogladius calderae 1633]
MGLRDYVAMTRPVNSLMSGLGALMALLVYRGYTPPGILVAVVATATGYLSTAASMLVNDYVDAAVDAVNKPWKPIPSGRVSRETTRSLGLALAVSSIVLNALLALAEPGLGWLPALVVAVYTLVGLAYSYLRAHWWSHLLVSLSTTGPVVYGYVLAGPPQGKLAFTAAFTVLVFLVTTGREVVKALQDVEGDKKAGYKTIPIVFGAEASRRLVLVIGASAPFLALVAYAFNGSTAFLVLILLAAAAYLHQAVKAYSRPTDKKVLEDARVKMLASMVLGLVAFWASGL